VDEQEHEAGRRHREKDGFTRSIHLRECPEHDPIFFSFYIISSNAETPKGGRTESNEMSKPTKNWKVGLNV
jgi:hypothetical protein